MIRKATVTVEVYVNETDHSSSLGGYFDQDDSPDKTNISEAVEKVFKGIADDANEHGYGYARIDIVGSNPAKVVYE